MQAILQRLEQQEAELRAMREQLDQHGSLLERLPAIADDPVMPAANLEALPVAAAAEKPATSSGKTEQKLDKKDEFPTFKTTGFTQLDSAWYSQTPLNRETVGDAQDGTGFRRARLAVLGKVAEFTNYQIEMDFATAGRPSFFDTYVEQTEVPHFGNIRVGHFCQPLSVDSLSGFRDLPFLERSLPFLALVPFRRIAAMAYDANEDLDTTWAYSVFRTGGFNNAPLGDNRFAVDIGDVGGYSFSGRLTHLWNYDELADGRYLWGIGASYDYSRLGANDSFGSGLPNNAGSPRPFYQARTTPEFGPLGYGEFGQPFGTAVNGTPIFVDTGRYAANNFNLFNVETVWQSGPLSLQAEWMGSVVDSVVGPVFYHGAYAELMWRPTGEHRVFDRKKAVFKNPIPFTDFISTKKDGVYGWGALEIAGRLSYVQLRNPDELDGHYYNTATNTFTGTSKAGNGTLTDTTLGLTWFLNQHFKLQFNWIHAMLNNTAKGFSTADLFVTRVQVDY